MFFPNWMKRIMKKLIVLVSAKLKVCQKNFRQFHHKLSYRLRPSSFFFLRLASSDRPKYLEFWKKKSSDVVKPFLTWNNSFNLKNEHSNSIEKNRNIFYRVLGILLIQIFNVVLGYQDLLFRDFLWIFLVFFFFSIRPTDPTSENAFDAK